MFVLEVQNLDCLNRAPRNGIMRRMRFSDLVRRASIAQDIVITIYFPTCVCQRNSCSCCFLTTNTPLTFKSLRLAFQVQLSRHRFLKNSSQEILGGQSSHTQPCFQRRTPNMRQNHTSKVISAFRVGPEH